MIEARTEDRRPEGAPPVVTVDEALDRARVTTAEGLELFDSLDTVTPEFMIGTWAGSELASGHRFDGLLAAAGWYGKQFVDTETVHPLLFHTADGRAAFPVNPAVLPLVPLPWPDRVPYRAVVAALRPLIGARRGTARLRSTEYRGRVSATMIYDAKPVNDVFRRISDDAVLGLMDYRGGEPFFFVLRRDESTPVLSP